MSADPRRTRVSVVAVPEAMLSTLSGLYDALNCFDVLGSFDRAVPRENPFQVEIVAPRNVPVPTASGLPLTPHRALADCAETDVVIVPSLMAEGAVWKTGRHADLVGWLIRQHARGAVLCSACSGVLLLAETGLLDGQEATIHWAFARTFRESFPKVRLRLEQTLVVTGARKEFVMSGASASWHDLVLYLVARQLGPTAAQAIAKFLALQWHVEGQGPYVMFSPPTDHGDAVVLKAQEWLASHFSVAAPVEEMVRRSGIPERSFKRRFTRATGHSPIDYVQHLRVEEAKRRLERTAAPIDEIGWNVGYEDPAFFRRLFKRITHVTPGAYRREFQLPDFVHAADGALGGGWIR